MIDLPAPKKTLDIRGKLTIPVPYNVSYGSRNEILSVIRVADTYVIAYWRGTLLRFSREYITGIVPEKINMQENNSQDFTNDPVNLAFNKAEKEHWDFVGKTLAIAGGLFIVGLILIIVIALNSVGE